MWGDLGLHLLMAVRMVGVLAIVGARPCGGTAQRRAAGGWLRVTTAALLPLAILQQRHHILYWLVFTSYSYSLVIWLPCQQTNGMLVGPLLLLWWVAGVRRCATIRVASPIMRLTIG